MKKNQSLLLIRTLEAVENYNKFKDEKALATLYKMPITVDNMYFISYAIASKKVVDIYDSVKRGGMNFEREMFELRNAVLSIRFDDKFNIINNYHSNTIASDIIQSVVVVLADNIGKTLSDEITYKGKQRVLKNICYDIARKTATVSNYHEKDENYIGENGKRIHRKTFVRNVDISLDAPINDTDGNATTYGDILVYEESDINDIESAETIAKAREKIKDATDRKIFDFLTFPNMTLENIAEEIGLNKSNVSRRIKAFAEKYPDMISILQHKN